MTAAAVAGWHVEAVPNHKGAKARPVRCSRVFVIRESAEQYADLLRHISKHPESVAVVTASRGAR